MSTCLFIYIYIYVYVYIHIHIHICVCVYMYIQICLQRLPTQARAEAAAQSAEVSSIYRSICIYMHIHAYNVWIYIHICLQRFFFLGACGGGGAVGWGGAWSGCGRGHGERGTRPGDEGYGLPSGLGLRVKGLTLSQINPKRRKHAPENKCTETWRNQRVFFFTVTCG